MTSPPPKHHSCRRKTIQARKKAEGMEPLLKRGQDQDHPQGWRPVNHRAPWKQQSKPQSSSLRIPRASKQPSRHPARILTWTCHPDCNLVTPPRPRTTIRRHVTCTPTKVLWSTPSSPIQQQRRTWPPCQLRIRFTTTPSSSSSREQSRHVVTQMSKLCLLYRLIETKDPPTLHR